MKPISDLLLCQLSPAVESKAQFDDLSFPFCQGGDHIPHHRALLLFLKLPSDTVRIASENVREQKLAAIAVVMERLVDGHLPTSCTCLA